MGDDTKCLAHKLAVDLRMPKANEGEGIGYFDIENGKLGDFTNLMILMLGTIIKVVDYNG